MERSVALAKIRKILGPKFNYRVDPRAPSKDEREEAKVAWKVAAAEQKLAEEAMRNRRIELLKDPEYVRLDEAWRAAQNKTDSIRGKLYHDKINVGVVEGPFNLIKASGDNWEEVIAKLQKK